MKKLNNLIVWLFVFSGTFILFSSLSLLKTNVTAKQPTVKIGEQVFKVEIMDSPIKWQQGLSGRKSICMDCGMLFVFPDKQIREFWMKDMNFSLDIIWITDNRVVGVERAVPAPTKTELPVVVKSPEAVNFVLEINQNKAEKISSGDSFVLIE